MQQKLLIVDDEEKIIEVLREYAEFEHFEVDSASNGMEAIQQCKNNKYDLVIMDVMMPKLDGFSAVQEIKKISDVPVIMLSARGEEYDKLFGFELGVDDYVVLQYRVAWYALYRVAVVVEGEALGTECHSLI